MGFRVLGPGALAALLASIFAVAGCSESSGPRSMACSSTLQCNLGELCVVGACVPVPASCVADADCPPGAGCLRASCVPDFCFADLDCGSVAVCDAYECRTACTNDRECEPGQLCTARGTCARPAVCNPPCGVREYCEETTLTCRERVCTTDDECIATDICVGGSCVPGCHEDDACGIGAICEDDVCVAGCRTDSGCTASQVCLGGVCVLGCDADPDCRAGEICVERACLFGCRDASQCDPGFVCVGEVGPCEQGSSCSQCELAPCDDDEHEPNQSGDEATELAAFVDLDAVACPANDDWYAVPAGVGCGFAVELAFEGGELSLEVSTDSDTLAVTPEEDAGGLRAHFYVGDAATVFVRVENAGALPTGYALRVDRLCLDALVCPDDDWFEDNDSAAASHPVGDIELVGAIACEGDADYYSVVAEVGCLIEADLDFSHADADLGLALLGPDEAELAASDTSEDRESVSALVETAGEHVLRVAATGAGSARYTLRPEVKCAFFTCPDNDGFEPNDDVDAATSGSRTLDGEGIICAADVDCFEVVLTSACVVKADLSYDRADGDLQLVLRDRNEVVLGNGSESASGKYAEALSLGAEPVYACVEAVGGDTNSYELAAVSECVSCPGGDAYEPNDTYDEATDLELGRTYLGVECEVGSSDYFRFVAPGDCSIRLELLAADDFDVTIYRRGDTGYVSVAEDTSASGNVTLTHPAEAGTTYWVHLYTFAVSIDTWIYTLLVTCQ